MYILLRRILVIAGCILYMDAWAQCNGDPNLCDKRFDQVVYVTTHNAFNYSGPFQAPNQTYPVSQQLQDGVRAFMLDVHDNNGVPTLFHSYAFLGNEPLLDVLIDVRLFLEQNTNEVVTLIFECYIAADEMDIVFSDAGLISFLHEQSLAAPWPTLQDLIDAGKNLVVLTDVDDAGPGQGWYHYMWDHCVETHYSANSRLDFSCDYNRGDSSNALFILNHFVTSIVGTGLFDSSAAVNLNPYLLSRSNECMTITGKLPNFLTVDFYEAGDVFITKDLLNDGFVGLEQRFQAHTFRVIPNPTSGLLMIDGFKGKVQVFDAYGKMQLTAFTNTLDISGLRPGVYYCIMEAEGRVVGKTQFVVSH
jgi:hypothetical protein